MDAHTSEEGKRGRQSKAAPDGNGKRSWNLADFVIPHSQTRVDISSSPGERPPSTAKKREANKKKPCPFCDIKYFHNKMAVHLMEMHSGVLENDSGFPLRLTRKLWAEDIVNLSCKICQIEFPNKLKFQRHMDSHLRLMCLVCSHVFTHYESLLSHMENHELGGSSEPRFSSSLVSGAGSEKLSIPPLKRKKKSSLVDRPESASPPPSGTQTTLQHCKSSSLTSAEHSDLKNDEAHYSSNSVVFNDEDEDSSELALEVKLIQPIVLLKKDPDIDRMCEAIGLLESEDSQHSISSVAVDIDSEKEEEECSPSDIHRPGPSLPSLFDFDSKIDDFSSCRQTDSLPQNADVNSSLTFSKLPNKSFSSSAAVSDEISLVQSFGESTSDVRGEPGSRLSPESFEVKDQPTSIWKRSSHEQFVGKPETLAQAKPKCKKRRRTSGSQCNLSIETPQKIKKSASQEGRKVVSPVEIKNLKSDLLTVDAEFPKKKDTKKVVCKYPSEIPYQDTVTDSTKKIRTRSSSTQKTSRTKRGSKKVKQTSGVRFAFRLDIRDNGDGGPRATIDVKLVDDSVDLGEYSMNQLGGDGGTRSFRWIDTSPYVGPSFDNALLTNPQRNRGQDPKYSDRYRIDGNHPLEEISGTQNSEDLSLVVLPGMESSMPGITSRIDSPEVVLFESWTSKIIDETVLKISRCWNPPDVRTTPSSSDCLADRALPSYLPDILETESNLLGGSENSRPDDVFGLLGNFPDAASKGGETSQRKINCSDNEGGSLSLFPETQRNPPDGCENSWSDVFGPLGNFPDTALSNGRQTHHRIDWGSDNEGGSPTLFGADFDDDSRVSPECPLQPNGLHHDPDSDEKKSQTTVPVDDSGEVSQKGGWGFGSDYESDEESTQCAASARVKAKNELSKKPEQRSYFRDWKEKKRTLTKILQEIDVLGPNIGTTKDRTESSHPNLLLKRNVSLYCDAPLEGDSYFGLSDASEPGPSCSSPDIIKNPSQPNKAHSMFDQDDSTDSSDLLRTPEYGSPLGSPKRPFELTPCSFSPINSDDDLDL